MSTLKTYINVNHIAEERWGLTLVDEGEDDKYAFCLALYRGIEGEDWSEMYEAYKEMSRDACVKKPQYKRPRKRKPSGK